MVPVRYDKVNYRQVVKESSNKTGLLLSGRVHHLHDSKTDLHVHDFARHVHRRKSYVTDEPDKPADEKFLNDGARKQ